MRLHEYQAKELLTRTGIPVPRGVVVSTPEEARAAFAQIGAPIAMVKAQALTGGRGKAGGIKAVHTPDEAYQSASAMLGRKIFTSQSPRDGASVRKVLIEAGLALEREYYLGITVDRERATPVFIACASGGMEIEEVARTHPERIIREYIEPVFGLQPYQARKIASAIGIPRTHIKRFVDIMLKLHIIFLVSDLELIEVNPLALVEDDDFVALDCKMVVDDGALFRHDDLARLYDPADADPLDDEARQAGVNYIRLKGNIGCMVNGAGLAMATMDLIKSCGGEPANFLDVGGGAGADKVAAALRILLADTQVEVVLLNIFGGILRCDVLAEGLASAVKSLEVKVPVVVRLEGTNKEEGVRILGESGMSFKVAHGMREAAEMAVGMLSSNA